MGASQHKCPEKWLVPEGSLGGVVPLKLQKSTHLTPEFLELFFCTINFRLDRKSCLNAKNQLQSEKTLFFAKNTKTPCFSWFPQENSKKSQKYSWNTKEGDRSQNSGFSRSSKVPEGNFQGVTPLTRRKVVFFEILSDKIFFCTVYFRGDQK